MSSRTLSQEVAVLLIILIIFAPLSSGTAMMGQSTGTQAELRGARLVGVKVQDEEGKVVTLYNESHALVIGISNYTNGWDPLDGVKQDVPAVKQALQKHGFVVEELLDETKEGIRHGVETFISKWGQAENNRLLIYFAGHGETLRTRDGRTVGYIVPVDAPKAQQSLGTFKQLAISLDEVEIWARQIESKHVLFVFDSCFSGALYEPRSASQLPGVIKAEAGNPVRQFITSGTAEQEVPDQSIFRTVFTKALEGAGDLNDDGYVTGSELGMHLRTRVSNYTENAQTPQYWKIRSPGLDKGEFVFVLPGKTDRTLIAEQKARALASIGMAYATTAEKQMVMQSYQRTLLRRREVNDRYGEAEILNNIGLLHESLGAYEDALNCFNLALLFWRSVNERRGEASTLNNIGRVYASVEENQRALTYYEQSLPISKALFDRAGEGVALTNIGAAYAALSDTEKALQYLNESIPLLQAVEDTAGEAITLITIGKVYASTGDMHKALEYSNRALAPLRSLGHRAGEAEALNNMGGAYASLGDYTKAIEFYNKALSLRQGIGDRRGVAETLYSIARAEQSLGNLSNANAQIKEALLITESLRQQVTDRDLRAAVFALGQKQYSLHIDVLQQLHLANPSNGYDAAALIASERSRARGLLETQINRSNSRYAALIEPRSFDLKGFQQQVLDPDTLLLEYALGEERSYLWAVTAITIRSYVLPPRKQIERVARDFYYQLTNRPLLGAPPDAGDQGLLLSRMLLGAVASELGNRRLLIVADGALHYVPFAALPDPNGSKGQGGGALRPLITGHEIVNVPSASTLAEFRRAQANRKPAPKALAIFADPVYGVRDERVNDRKPDVRGQLNEPEARDANEIQLPSPQPPDSDIQQDYSSEIGMRLARLPYARLEAEKILSLARNDSLALFGFEANRSAALSPELGQYRILHFATHSFFDNSDPERSAIVLSLVDAAGKPRSGMLRPHDVYNMNLQSDLVVLSSCSTGLGKEVKGEGVAGFARAFMYAGVPRVVVSLWNVDDQATAELMTRFYKGMLINRLPASAALRQAQLSLLSDKRFASTYTWRAFVLQGDWR